MGFRLLIIAIAVLALASSFAQASDPSPLQDFCVAINDSKAAVFVNGKICKNPMEVDANDFLFQGLNKPGNTSNPLGSAVSPVNVNNLSGLNTLGISLARIDFEPYGLNPPHTHPRATEVLTVLEGTLYVGFVLSNPAPGMKNKLFTSQNPGVITIANAVFGSDPPINPNVLTKAFQVDKNVINYLQSQFWYNNN
nr:putative germin-like protein 2-1 [Ipomoea trifida]GMD18487.1 putative germin-like protein 2-1 [Ipomoea batatas]GLL25730.1 putative germin-like protein 2-1 [Ipomoea trifida]GLL25732.1 putative germin-like protein 2-1 [Ipomoea trifida]GLL25734.1 putative germin-like protein 2-1 [Ipomoea trifida]